MCRKNTAKYDVTRFFNVFTILTPGQQNGGFTMLERYPLLLFRTGGNVIKLRISILRIFSLYFGIFIFTKS